MAHATKFTGETRGKILMGLELGMCVEQIAERVGICKKTFYNWLDRGKNGDPEYAPFYEECCALRYRVNCDLLAQMHEMAHQKEDPGVRFRACDWLLTRLYKHYPPPSSGAIVDDDGNAQPTLRVELVPPVPPEK